MGSTISNAQWLNVAINTVLPILVAIITARTADGGVKAVVLLFLSALSGFLVAWLDAVNNHLTWDWSQALFTVAIGFVAAVAAHFGVWKPGHVTGATGKIQSAAPAGLGARSVRAN